jgi:hypothetical protein
VEDLKWLGLHGDDKEAFGIPDDCLQPLTAADKQKLRTLAEHPFVKVKFDWQMGAEIVCALEHRHMHGLRSVAAVFEEANRCQCLLVGLAPRLPRLPLRPTSRTRMSWPR